MSTDESNPFITIAAELGVDLGPPRTPHDAIINEAARRTALRLVRGTDGPAGTDSEAADRIVDALAAALPESERPKLVLLDAYRRRLEQDAPALNRPVLRFRPPADWEPTPSILAAARLVSRADAAVDLRDGNPAINTENKVALLLHLYRAGDKDVCYAIDLAHDALSTGAEMERAAFAAQRPSLPADVAALVEEARELGAVATKGPWETDGYAIVETKWTEQIEGEEEGEETSVDICEVLSEGIDRGGNARFIARARTLVPEMAAALSAQAGEVERLRRDRNAVSWVSDLKSALVEIGATMGASGQECDLDGDNPAGALAVLKAHILDEYADCARRTVDAERRAEEEVEEEISALRSQLAEVERERDKAIEDAQQAAKSAAAHAERMQKRLDHAYETIDTFARERDAATARAEKAEAALARVSERLAMARSFDAGDRVTIEHSGAGWIAWRLRRRGNSWSKHYLARNAEWIWSGDAANLPAFPDVDAALAALAVSRG